MKNLKIYLAIFIALVFYFNASAQTVEEIIGKHVEAIGGSDNIMAVKTMKTVGFAKMMGMEFPFTIYNVVPDKVYFELSVQGKLIKQGCDGTTAWAVNPMGGSSTPEAVEGEEAGNIKDRAKIFDKLVSYKDDGGSVELTGKEQVNNIETFKIKYTGKDGKSIVYYVGTSDYMLVKTQRTLRIQGQEMESETYYSNFKKAGDVMMAYSMDVKTKGSPMGTQEITMDKYEMNPTIDEKIFTLPTK
ncbi:MAG: hypothetical protein WCK13_04975 [Ignavibacteriota bacterium]|nr:hypothetical protein [Ignavibacteriota bacterium]